MNGIYRFYQDGVMIHEEKNLLTTSGKAAILRYLAGYTGHFGKSIRLGVGSTAANVADATLNFETVQSPVTLISPDFSANRITFKTRIPENVAGTFYEAGLNTGYFDQVQQYGSTIIFTFDNSVEGWTAGTYNIANGPRVGSGNLRIAAAANTTTTATLDTLLDLSGYSSTDDLKLAYRNASTAVATMYLRFYTDAANYFTYTITNPAASYNIATFKKSDFVATGTPSWSNITQAEVSVTANAAAATVDFDAFRIDDKDTYTQVETLVSRTVLGTPVTKTVGVPLDIEYTLDLTL